MSNASLGARLSSLRDTIPEADGTSVTMNPIVSEDYLQEEDEDDQGYHHPRKLKSSRKLKYGKVKFRLIKSQVRGSYAREKVNEHFSIVSGDCTLHDDSYGCFAVANASIDREIWTNKGDLARVTKYGNILMVLLGVATMNNLE